MTAIITKKGSIYSLEYKDNWKNKVIIDKEVNNLIELVNWKVQSLLIKYI